MLNVTENDTQIVNEKLNTFSNEGLSSLEDNNSIRMLTTLYSSSNESIDETLKRLHDNDHLNSDICCKMIS